MLEQKLIRGRGVTLAGAALFCRLSLGLGLVFAGALSGCKGTVIRPSALDSEVHEYVRLAVGLGQRDADSLDYYSGSGASVADTMQHPPSLKALHRSAADLLASVEREQPASEEGKARRAFLLRQLQAMAARIDLIEGVPSSFDAETKASFGVVIPASYDRPDVASVQAELQKLLPGKGTLAERYQAFDNRFIVQPKLLSVVMDRAIADCRATTQQHVTLPAGEAVTVEYVRNKPWSAYSWYKGGFHSVIQVNRDFGLTVDRVMNLACHEAYPGHHTYNSIRDAELVRGKGLQEYSVQPTFSPQSMISESIANLATDVAFPADKRLAFERDVLFPLAGLDSKDAALYLRVEALVDRLHMVEPSVAREYLDGRLEFERAGAELESGALMVHPEAALLYMNEYRSYVATYTYGRDLVTAELQRRSGGDADMQWKIYRQWMNVDPKLEGMHSETAKGMTLSHAGGG